MSPSPTPVPLTYSNMADLFVPIYFVMALALSFALLYLVYKIGIKPWLRG